VVIATASFYRLDALPVAQPNNINNINQQTTLTNVAQLLKHYLTLTVATFCPNGIPQLLSPLQQPVVCLQQLANSTFRELDPLTKFIFDFWLVRL